MSPARLAVLPLLLALASCGGSRRPVIRDPIAGRFALINSQECPPYIMEVGGVVRLIPGTCRQATQLASIAPSTSLGSSSSSRGSRGGDRRFSTGTTSVGMANRGRLTSGLRVERSSLIDYVASEVHGRSGGNFYGTDEMAGLLERTAATMREFSSGTALRIGEISSRHGGPLAGHRSHQSGRDVDIAFYYKSARGRPAEPDRFVNINRNGKTEDHRGGQLTLDARASWKLVETLLLDLRVNIQFIFVAGWVESRLLDAGRQMSAPDELIQHAEAIMRQPDGHPHANHFHVRIYCDADDLPTCQNGAYERPPYGFRTLSNSDLIAAVGRAQELGLGNHNAGRTLLRDHPPRDWMAAVPGANPRKLRWPVREGRFGRGFGYTRRNLPDVLHRGVDIGAVPNSIIRAAADGVVAFSGEYNSFGNCIFLVHRNGWVTTYAHNRRNTVLPGELVRAGDPIALIGSTGLSRGPHLHFEFRDRGRLRDPQDVLESMGPRTRARTERVQANPDRRRASPDRTRATPSRIPQRVRSSTPAEPEEVDEEEAEPTPPPSRPPPPPGAPQPIPPGSSGIIQDFGR